MTDKMTIDATAAFQKKLWTHEFLDGKDSVWDDIQHLILRIRSVLVNRIKNVSKIKKYISLTIPLRYNWNAQQVWLVEDDEVVIDKMSYKLLIAHPLLIRNIILSQEDIVHDVQIDAPTNSKKIYLKIVLGYLDDDDNDDDDDDDNDDDDDDDNDDDDDDDNDDDEDDENNDDDEDD
jgi:hypothetical protein